MMMRTVTLAVLCLLPATARAQDCGGGVEVVDDLTRPYKHPQLDLDQLTQDVLDGMTWQATVELAGELKSLYDKGAKVKKLHDAIKALDDHRHDMSASERIDAFRRFFDATGGLVPDGTGIGAFLGNYDKMIAHIAKEVGKIEAMLREQEKHVVVHTNLQPGGEALLQYFAEVVRAGEPVEVPEAVLDWLKSEESELNELTDQTPGAHRNTRLGFDFLAGDDVDPDRLKWWFFVHRRAIWTSVYGDPRSGPAQADRIVPGFEWLVLELAHGQRPELSPTPEHDTMLPRFELTDKLDFSTSSDFGWVVVRPQDGEAWWYEDGERHSFWKVSVLERPQGVQLVLYHNGWLALTLDGDGQVVAAERWKRSEDDVDHEVTAELRKGWIRER